MVYEIININLSKKLFDANNLPKIIASIISIDLSTIFSMILSLTKIEFG